ncbi:uncharacterized protein LOC26528211 [Drosophila mojavensis]|uniref:Uncharacterized protein n=1 Tax=Drosophila mojavensis TaxID=7230 RepID=A0A0Q9XQV7_DROMO|nr:uncharacterized protein LOC26528211 [Drosophila mojavensis]KRG07588.1 uncharacterized protein Dmoj_GI26570 [Drosophila mojavensis]
MESIVLHSDIARLVLGYFVNNNLRRAALSLCRTSPHLHQEFIALRQGLQPHNFLNDGLEDIIREHVRITSMVANAVKKLPNDTRQRLQQLKLSERVDELLKLNRSTTTSTTCNKDSTACMRNTNPNTQHTRKRRRVRVNSLPLDGEQANPVPRSPSERFNCKRPRLLDPHLYCSIGRTDHIEEYQSLDSSTTSDFTSEQTDDPLHFRHGHGPKNNSTPRITSSEESELMMPMPQTMPEITQAIMTNHEFQNKLLSNINTALQSLTVHAPTAESVNSEAVLDGLVRNILEATEKDPSFDRIIQEVVGMDTSADEPIPTAVEAPVPVAAAEVVPAPPQTPLIIRTAVASANAAAASVNANGDINMGNGNNGNAIILNANSSIGTLIDPNFSISKLIVLNSNESAQKQHQQQPTGNLSFGSENLINFADGGSTMTDPDSVASVAAVNGGQVCVDATNGQLTFPMFLSNEGLLSHLPFLVNNEWLAQQLRSDTFTNMDVSHIEIPLPEPITVAANQLPPNSIIINSAVKQPPTTEEEPSVEPPAQLIADQAKAVAGNTSLLERSSSKVASASAVPASLDSSRLVLERVTPSTSGIVNVKAFRSLSTPRKRTSHVRTLNFSPKGIPHMQGVTPLSTRRLQTQRRTQLKTEKGKKAEELIETSVQPEKTLIIKNVEVLPSFGTTPSVPLATNASEAVAASENASENTATAATRTPADVSSNESNGCVPPFFAMEECSNQTVIKAVTAPKQLATNSSTPMVVTPKRKQTRRAATKACKRIISQAAVGDEANDQQEADKEISSSLDDSKENERLPTTQHVQLPEQKTELNKEKDDLLAAWQRQMNSTSTDLDLRLREINAKRQEALQSKPRARRHRPVVANKKKALALSVSLTPLISKKRTQRRRREPKGSNNVEGEFTIKITTPQKPLVKPKVVSQDILEPKEVMRPKESKQNKEYNPTKKIVKSEHEQQLESMQQTEQPVTQPAVVNLNTKNKPPDCDMSNMAVLLETPFKVTLTEVGDIPPTPGPMLMDTPYAKLLPSASFLFGSDTKSILDTPMLTAITPGIRLTTPFGHALNTPHSSAAKTEYSGGSSYYRPDEAEHTDTNAQCALPSTSPRDLVEQAPKQFTTHIELQAERLPVEPTVLRRVRSFGSEAVDSIEGAAALSGNGESSTLFVETPHYKLVSGLPDAVVEHSSSNSSGSSSTSSSSCSSSSSGSSSNSSLNTSASSAMSGRLTNAVTPARPIKLLELENLSDISSTEDDEWLKVAAACGSLDAPPLDIDSEPAKLVSQDGEVRYPLRSWLTPSKEAAAAATVAADADTSGEMAPPAPVPEKLVPNVKAQITINSKEESIEQRMMDLAAVRERVKAKFKQQTTPKGRPRKVNKKLSTMRETAKLANPNVSQGHKSPMKEFVKVTTDKEEKVNNASEPEKNQETSAGKPVNPMLIKSSEGVQSNLEKPEPASSNLDPALLFALNLSAKKQQQPRTGRVAVQISAQPAPSMTTGQRRGRPRKPPNMEPSRSSMRRSCRLIDNKTPAPEEPRPCEAGRPVKTSNNTKVTKKPAKKRAEARTETAAPSLATLAEAQTTQQSAEQLQPRSQPPASSAAPDASGDYDLDMCLTSSHVANTYSFAYEDSGSKPTKPVLRQPPAFFKNFQMRIMVDNEMHSVRITSPQVLHQSLDATDDNASPTGIRNIPKKRIIHFTSVGGGIQELAAAQDMPMASSTPLATNTQIEEHDDNDMEVASINTPQKSNTSEEQQMELHDAGVQIEDIESILSHLHGT